MKECVTRSGKNGGGSKDFPVGLLNNFFPVLLMKGGGVLLSTSNIPLFPLCKVKTLNSASNDVVSPHVLISCLNPVRFKFIFSLQ